MPDSYQITPIEHMKEAAACLKVIANPVRLQIVELLLDHRLRVNDIADLTDTPQNVVSEHLKRLREHGLVSMEREGRCVYCRVIEPGMRSIIQCVQARYASARLQEQRTA